VLRTLSIQNLAVIEDAQIELGEGFNVFTGTTGAGKSLVIGALELLLGLRASSQMVRSGATEARVSALFEIHDEALRRQIEEALDVSVEDGQLAVTRRVPASGSSRASLNGQAITAAMLRTLGQLIVDIHGQYDQQYLLLPANQLAVLDVFGKLNPVRCKYAEQYAQHRDLLARKAELEAGRQLRGQQLELYEFQADEIDRAQMQPGELAETEARRSRLANAERLAGDLGAVYQSLYESDGSITDRLKAMTTVLEELMQFDASLDECATTARDAAYSLEDLAYQIRGRSDRVESSPQALAEAEERLRQLRRLTDKYGPGEADVLRTRDELDAKLSELRAQTDDATHIDDALARVETALVASGGALTAARKKIARQLEKRIVAVLKELEMKETRFEIRIEPTTGADGRPAPTPTGLDRAEFLIAPNPGEPLQPLRKIASGGELSRVMLALKSVLARADRVSVLVFDEIDSNIGGRLGSVIGRKLRDLARHHQVVCITHLAQIAGFAERHLTVRKQSRGGRSYTRVEQIDGDARVTELAEMIGGQDVSATTRKQARELLKLATK
jgi:DNA repair protein RecN (Recombination protein N)